MYNLPIHLIYNNILPFLEPHIRVELKCKIPVKLNMSKYNIKIQKHTFQYCPNTYFGKCWCSGYFYILDKNGTQTNMELTKWIYDNGSIRYKFEYRDHNYWDDYWYDWCSNCGRTDMIYGSCDNCNNNCVCNCFHCDKTITNEEKKIYLNKNKEFIYNDERIPIERRLLHDKLDLVIKDKDSSNNNFNEDKLRDKINNCKSLYDTTELWGIIGDYNISFQELKKANNTFEVNSEYEYEYEYEYETSDNESSDYNSYS